MKRLLLFCLVIIFIISGCNNKKNNIININEKVIDDKTETLSNKVIINYPVTTNFQINEYIKNELVMTSNKILRILDLVQAVIECQTVDNGTYFSVIYDITIISLKRYQRFLKTYSFNYEQNALLYLNDTELQDVILPIINDNIHGKLLLDPFTVLQIPYIITPNTIKFFVNDNLSQIIEINIDKINISQKKINQEQIKPTKQVVLTFDDGPSNKTTLLLALLRKYNIKATFFLLGLNALIYQEEVKQIAQDKHEIGNHSYSHRDLSKANIETILFEIDQTQEILKEIVGYYPQLFRFPYGAFLSETLEYIRYPIIHWNVDSLDWKDITKEEKMDIIFNNIPDKAIIIFHDSYKMDLQLIEEVILKLKDMNYQFITTFEYFDFRNKENIITGKIYR